MREDRPAPVSISVGSEPVAWTTKGNLETLASTPKEARYMWGLPSGSTISVPLYSSPQAPAELSRGAADAYVAEQGIEHSGGIVEQAFEAGVRRERRSLPEGFNRQEIEDMLSIVQAEEQTIDGGGEFGPQESTDGWYTRLLSTILKNAEGAR